MRASVYWSFRPVRPSVSVCPSTKISLCRWLLLLLLLLLLFLVGLGVVEVVAGTYFSGREEGIPPHLQNSGTCFRLIVAGLVLMHAAHANA